MSTRNDRAPGLTLSADACDFIPAVIDDHSRVTCARFLPDDKALTCAAFLHPLARIHRFFLIGGGLPDAQMPFYLRR